MSRWFADEVQPHEPMLRTWLRGAFPGKCELDDVVQESYLRVWRARAAAPIRSTKAFLFRVARNVVIDLLRRERNSPVDAVADLASLPAADERPTGIESVTADERLELLADAIAALPPRGRELILLCKIHGLTHQEAATQLGVSHKTVDEHISRGLKQLGAKLRARGYETCF